MQELKKAYKRKAMLLHPDVSSSLTAEKDFVQLKIAYEYLSSPRRKIIPKKVKNKASYQTKKKAYSRHKAREQKFKKRTQGKRTYKKEIERFDWYGFLRDILRLFKGMLLFSFVSSLVVTLFSCFDGIHTVLNSIFVVNMFILIFAVLILIIFIFSYLPDMLKSTSAKIRSRYKK